MRGRKTRIKLSLVVILLLFIIIQFNVNWNTQKKKRIDNEIKVSVSSSETTDDTDNVGKTDNTNNERSYESFLSFPYDNMIFADKETFDILKDSYAKINFYGQFKKGNNEVYDYYKKKYDQLLKNEVIFTDNKTGEELYLNELDWIVTDDNDMCDIKNYSYYFFDIDEDDAPELGIIDTSYNKCIFKYIPIKNKFILWYDMSSCWYDLMGTQKIYWMREGLRNVFYKLDEYGKEEFKVFFYQYEDVYMAAIPKYMNKEEQVEITEKLRKHAYFDEGQEIYYYRVTEEQYNDLTENYYNALELAKKNIKEVTYTYEELFGDLND